MEPKLFNISEVKTRKKLGLFGGVVYDAYVLIEYPREEVEHTKEYIAFCSRRRKRWWEFWFKEVEPSQNIINGNIFQRANDFNKAFID